MTPIKILTSDDKWYKQAESVSSIIQAMGNTSKITITTNGEGPDLNSNDFIAVLDTICENFEFDKSQIEIHTANKIQSHCDYAIKYSDFTWVKTTAAVYSDLFNLEMFLGKKDITKNLFASFNNRPTWYRICLVEHLSSLGVPVLLTLKLSNSGSTANSVDYNKLFDEVGVDEFYKLCTFLKNGSITLPVRPLSYENGFGATLADLSSLYNDFFIDVIGNTFTVGHTFYMDEKEARPLYCCTPFITYGAQGHLGYLRGEGFRTFSDWWDESYDHYSGFARVEKIKETLTNISRLSANELQSMYNDMMPTLKHNHINLIEKYGKK